MNRLPKSLRLPREAPIDPTWPQQALHLRRNVYRLSHHLTTAQIATEVGVPFEVVADVLRNPERIEKVQRMREWSKR